MIRYSYNQQIAMPHCFVTLVACLFAGGLSILGLPRATGQDGAPVTHLLPNPSFEQLETGDVPGWKSRAWSGEAAARWTVDEPGRSGKQCRSTCDAAGGKWRIVPINRRPSETLRCELKLGSRTLEGTYGATQLAGDSPDAYNDVERPDRVVPRRVEITVKDGQTALPPHSVTILEVPGDVP